MKAKDIMTRHVITVGAEMPVNEVAKLLLDRNISAVPVVDDAGKVIGIVSEGDLVFRHEIGTDQPKHSWWLRLINDNAAMANEYLKTHGKVAGDVMTKDIVSVTEETPVSDIARLMERHHIKRVPVVADEKLVGIVSRANIVRRIASAKELHVENYVDDEAVRHQVESVLDKQPWASAETTSITVSDGVVEFWGMIGSEAERDASRVAAEAVSGVKEVVDHRQVRQAVIGGGI